MLCPPWDTAVVIAWLGLEYLKCLSKFAILPGVKVTTLPPNFVFNNLTAFLHSSTAITKFGMKYLYHQQSVCSSP